MDSGSTSFNERAFPLLSMPNEIVEMIAAFADDAFSEERPLSKLRLTCRQLRGQVSPEFARRYLSEPFIMMSHHSLEALIDICRHPIFGPRVRKIRLRAYADRDRVVETLAKRKGYGLLEPDKPFTVHQTPEDRVKKATKILVREKSPLRTSEEATKLLRTAFNLLSEYARPLILCVETRFPSQWPNRNRSVPVSFGDQATIAFRETLDWTDRRSPTCGMILQNLLKLADKSGCKVQGIEMNGFGSLNLNRDRLHHPFEINHPLVLDLRTARYKGDISTRCVNGSMALLRLINQSKKLSSLSLGNCMNLNSRCIRYMCGDVLLGQIRLPALEVLDLDGMMVPVEKLQEFLIEHKYTLKQVHLQNLLVSIPASNETSLSRIMSWTRDNIALKRVTLGEIRVILDNDWRASTTDRPGVPWHSGVTNLEGSAAVRAGLNELCDQHKRSRKLLTDVHIAWELYEKIPLFARTAGMSEEGFRQIWASSHRCHHWLAE